MKMRPRAYLVAVLALALCAQLLWLTTQHNTDTSHLYRPALSATPRPAAAKPSRDAGRESQRGPPSSSSTLNLLAPGGALRVRLNFSSALAAAWQSSSRRESFGSGIHLTEDNGGSRHCLCTVTLYGKSSLKLKYTTRRSIEVLTHEPVQLRAGGPSMRRFLLLSLWEDSTRLGYRSSAALLAKAGLFYSDLRLVDFGCAAGDAAASVCRESGGTLGVYLALEYPSDAIVRQAQSSDIVAAVPCRPTGAGVPTRNTATTDVEIGTRNWFYFEKPAKYDLLHVPSYQRNSSLSAQYRGAEADPAAAEAAGRFDFAQYMLWLVANTLLQNGDYDDEVFVWAARNANGEFGPLQVGAWDYDNVFSPCHRGGKQALKTKFMYCAETPLERVILHTPALLKRYTDTIQCALAGPFSRQAWAAVVADAQKELNAVIRNSLTSDVALATWPRGSSPRPASLETSDLTDAFNARADMLAALVGSSAAPTAASVDRAVSSSTCPLSGEGLRKAFAPEHKGTLDVGKALTMMRRGMASNGNEAKAMVQWQLGLNGNTTWAVADATAAGALATEGLHCAALFARGESIPCAAVPFVVRSKERGKTEFGVAHWAIAPLASLAAPVAQSRRIALKAPTLWPRGLPFPLVARVLVNGLWDRAASVVSLPLRVGDDSIGSLLVMRGFSGTLASSHSNSGPSALGPVMPLGAAATAIQCITGGVKSAVAVPIPAAETPVTVPSDVGSTFTCRSGTTCTVASDGVTVRAGGRFVMEPGSALLFAAQAEVTVEAGAHFQAAGTATNPISITAPDGVMKGIACSGKASRVNMAHVFLTRSGVPLPDKSEDRGTGHHHHHTAAVTATDGCTVTVEGSVFFALSGPALAAGPATKLVIRDTLVQQAEMGAECTGCDLDADRTAWLQLASPDMREAPFLRPDGTVAGPTIGYEDNDNDALYLSGGVHRVAYSVIARTTDDGIDTGNEGAPRGSTNGGSLVLEHTIIEDAQHEGVAVSGGAPGLGRDVTIRSSLIQRCQQGVECGYAENDQTRAVVEATVVRGCQVGVRFGDNYRRSQKGKLLLKGCSLVANDIPALNYVRKLAGPATHEGALAFEETIVVRNGTQSRSTACSGLVPTLPDSPTPAPELDLAVPLQ